MENDFERVSFLLNISMDSYYFFIIIIITISFIFLGLW